MRFGILDRLSLLSITGLLLCAAIAAAADVTTPKLIDGRIGFDGHFKVGHWTPLSIAAGGDVEAAQVSVEAVVPDSNGVPVSVRGKVPIAEGSGEKTRPTLLYTKVGRIGAAIEAKLIADDGRVLDRRTLPFAAPDREPARFTPMPSTGEIVLQLGLGKIGLREAVPLRESADGTVGRAVVEQSDVDILPLDWFGYDAVDVMVLDANDEYFCQRLARDERRLAALERWLELGGRLVVCGGRNLLTVGRGNPLARLLPGTFREMVRLPRAQALENYAGSNTPIDLAAAQQEIMVPRLEDVHGRVEMYGRGNDLPLVVRAARGLGEIGFVGLDLDQPPLADWPGRNAFWQAVLRPYLSNPDETHGVRQTIVSLGYDDLAGALRQRLGMSFAGVTAIGFPLVAVLVIGYLLLVGPLDYLFVHRFAKRPLVAWVTLPLLVLGTCLGAMSLAGAAKETGGLRMNAAEVVDFDLVAGLVRGTCWATLYSPRAQRFDVTISPRMPGDSTVADAQCLVSWLGLPGSGLGGMHARGAAIDVVGVGYQQSENLEQLIGVPVLTAATKSLSARWDATIPAAASPLVAAELAVDDDGLLVGSLANQTGAPLKDACLLHGQWGYRLGDLPPGKRIEISPRLNAIRVQTIVARRAGYDVSAQRGAFLADRASAAQLLNVMMFYEAVGGEQFAGLPNRYQANCDLSPLLALDRAVLMAGGEGGSRWIDAASGETLAPEKLVETIIYRFVLPLGPSPNN